MKMKGISTIIGKALVLGFYSIASENGSAQGMFGNLDFEAATVPTATPAGTFVDVSNALPGWTVFYGTNQQSQVVFNTIAAGSANVSLVSTNGVGAASIQGRYSAVIQSGGSSFQVPATIAQTGLIPAGSMSIQFMVEPLFGLHDGGFTVSVGGENIPLTQLSGPVNSIYEYGGDISAFAGQTEEIRISSIPIPATAFSSYTFDSILFSTQPVPEPETWALLLSGAAVFAAARWRSLCRK